MAIVSLVAGAVGLYNASLQLAQSGTAQVNLTIPSDLPPKQLKRWLEDKIDEINNKKIPELEQQKTSWNVWRNTQLDGEIAQWRAWEQQLRTMLGNVKQQIAQSETQQRAIGLSVNSLVEGAGIGTGGDNKIFILVAVVIFIFFIFLILALR